MDSESSVDTLNSRIEELQHSVEQQELQSRAKEVAADAADTATAAEKAAKAAAAASADVADKAASKRRNNLQASRPPTAPECRSRPSHRAPRCTGRTGGAWRQLPRRLTRKITISVFNRPGHL